MSSNYIVHKEKAKQELSILINKIKNNQLITNKNIDDHLETTLTHLYKFILGKLRHSKHLDD